METGVPLGVGRVQNRAGGIFWRTVTSLFGRKPEQGVGSERFYLAPPGLIKPLELPAGWGLLELRRGRIEMVQAFGDESADGN